jgi:tRNA(Arg) A34 adenosine deaminase TadA
VEPCVMCAYAIRLARVSIVVSGTRSSNRLAADAAEAVLNDAGLLPGRTPPLSIRGILPVECNELLREPT